MTNNIGGIIRKINDLQADEFPGVDQVKFKEWKVLQEKGNKTMIGLIIATSIMALLFLLIDIGGFVIAFIIVLSPILAKAIAMGPANRFAEEIGLK